MAAIRLSTASCRTGWFAEFIIVLSQYLPQLLQALHHAIGTICTTLFRLPSIDYRCKHSLDVSAIVSKMGIETIAASRASANWFLLHIFQGSAGCYQRV